MKIITDSTCDLDFDFLKENGVEIVHLKYFFGEEEFVDGVSMSKADFYEKLATSSVLPTTSQPSPEQFATVFDMALDGDEDVLGIFISSELSGTFQSAMIAKGMVDSDKVFLVDSKAATLCLGVQVLQAIKYRDNGLSAKDIKAKLDENVNKVQLFAAVGTLKYLQMGGRLSKTAATVGSMLNMKPIVTVLDGKVASHAKARGEQGAFEKIYDAIQQNPIDTDFPVIIGHSNDTEACQHLFEFLTIKGVDFGQYIRAEIGTVIGVHIGPGAFGIAYQSKN